MEQRVCDICKNNLADMSFKVKRSNRSLINFWSRYEDIDVCNECGNKLLGVANLMAVAPVRPPKREHDALRSYNSPVPTYRPPMPPSSGSSVHKKDE